MSTARPCTCSDSAGGSTHCRALAGEPYLATASSYSCCCFSGLRHPEVTCKVTPSACAAAFALARARCSALVRCVVSPVPVGSTGGGSPGERGRPPAIGFVEPPAEVEYAAQAAPR